MFQMSGKANLETEFYERLTRQGAKTAKHDEEMSICSSTPHYEVRRLTEFCNWRSSLWKYLKSLSIL